MNKYIPSNESSQIKFNDISPNSTGFISNNSNLSIKLTLNYLISRSNLFKSLYMRQDTIAESIGYCKKTVTRAVDYLHIHGFIFKHYRPGKKTCEYFVNTFFFTTAGRLFLLIIFQISFLCVGSEPYVPQLILTNANKNESANPNGTNSDVSVPNFYKNCTGTNIALNTNHVKQDLYSTQERYELFRTEIKGEPNQKISFDQFEAIYFPKKESYMNNFTEEQLVQLAQYSKDTLNYATKMFTKDMASGKQMGSQFDYFKSICFRYASKTPKTGTTKFHEPVNTKKWQADDEDIRERLNQRKQNIIAKAKELGVYNDSYTLEDLRLLCKGYKVVLSNDKQDVDLSSTEVRIPTQEPVTQWNDLIFDKGNAIIPPVYEDEAIWEEI